MRALLCRQWCEFGDLAIEEVEPPPLRAGSVRIGVRYASLSYAINLMVAGKYQQRIEPPFVPGKEVAGIVTEVADDVEGIAPGNRVVAIVDSGGFAEEAVADAAKVYVLPSGIALKSALPLPISYGSSYAALVWRARVQPGETLLVHGAAGGIGLAAVQLARQLGARVIASASTEAKREFLRTRGADRVVPSSGFRDAVREYTAGRGADVVFDPVGGRVFDESLRCVAPEGRILVMGFASGEVPKIPANLLLVKDVAVLGFYFGRYTGGGAVDESEIHAPRLRAMMATLVDWTLSGRIEPAIARCFPFEQYGEAMQALLSRTLAGKIALEIGPPE